MASPALPLSDVVNVTVLVSPQLPNTPTFNQGLIIGTSAVIPSIGANSRLRQYTSLAGMVADGFTTSQPEYLAAALYFAQSPAPRFVWIGRADLTALNTIIPHSGNAGTGYKVGDVITVVQGGASGGTATVATIGGGGAVTGLNVNTAADGTGYATATALATTGGSGTSLQVDITLIGEAPLTAVQNCRTASAAWYACMATEANDTDHLAIALYAQSANPPIMYFLTTADAAVLNNTANNLCATLKADGYNRVWSIYSTTQGGSAPNNVYACAAAMGVVMGLNTGLANSFFTMMFKTLVGVTSEPLTQSQVTTLCGVPGSTQGINCNVYVGYANAYTFAQLGAMANGQFLDEVLNLDMLSSAIQFNVANVLISLPSVPQTDPGQTLLLHAVNQACQAAVARGFIAPGIWEGVTILNLANGDNVPAGYLSQSPPYSTQSQTNRAVRQAMPIYVAIIEAGAVNFVLIGVYVQR